ncbi:MAG: response regulator [Gammaproteobacteria bacterium]|nr:response regulator [Gammaproteobacteria bacterium]
MTSPSDSYNPTVTGAQAVPFATVIMIEHGRIVAWPQSAQHALGWAADEVLNQGFLTLLAPDVSFHAPGVELADTDDVAFEGCAVATAVTHRDGSRRAVELVFVPDTSGTSERVAVAIRASGVAGGKSQAVEQAAENPIALESEFLARMSHEIRTPMNGVLGMLELMQSTELSGIQKRYADAMNRSALALLQIVNDILDFSKIEAGKLELITAPFCLQELLDDVNELFAEAARKKGVELLNERAADTPRQFIGDAYRLRQILVNLVGNAIKFTDTGEVVTAVEVSRREHDALLLRFSVRDTGVGIAPERHSDIFHSFVQTDDSATRRHGGTGLGLPISRQLVELMGGHISVSSEPGKGSTFSFTVNLRERRDSIATMPSQRIVDARILIADDNPPSRRILALKLESWGMQVASAQDGSEAWSLMCEASAEGNPFDIAILDRMMPGLDGLALARKIKSEASLRGTRLIMLSGVRDQDSDTWRSAGIDYYLTKPARLSEIRDTLMQLTDTSEATGESSEKLQLPPLNARLLVVEDNEVNQDVARGMLKILGCEVDIAANGRLALAAIEETDYDLILMDCHMPEMDGFEATRAIRQRERRNEKMISTPIVALTANARPDDSRACKAAGMDDFLSKPFSVEQLHSTLASWLPGNAGAAPA